MIFMMLIKSDYILVEVFDLDFIENIPENLGNLIDYDNIIEGEYTNFIKVDYDPQLIQYLKSLKYILDYNQVCNFSEEKLKEKIDELEKKIPNPISRENKYLLFSLENYYFNKTKCDNDVKNAIKYFEANQRPFGRYF